MIILIFGNVGSGKTSFMVYEMMKHPERKYITNIKTYGKEFKHVTQLKADMLIKKELVSNKRDGTPVYKNKLNIEFWKELIKREGEVNICIDEAHIFLNPRRSMSSRSIIATDFLSLIRRVTNSSGGEANCYLISQLSRRLDIISKELAQKVIFIVHHYTTKCSKCGAYWEENNETANKFEICPRCKDYRIKKVKSIIEVFEFNNIDKFTDFKEYKLKTYYKRYLIKDITTSWGHFDTLQIDDLLSEY